MNGHSIQKCLENILASSGDVLRETIPTIPVLLFLIIIGDQFGQRKFLIKDLACVSDTCGNHGELSLGTRSRYPRGRRILASLSSRVVFFSTTLPLAWPLCTYFVFGCCSCSNIDLTGKMSRIIVIFEIFWTMCSLFLRAIRVKLNWLLSRQHVHLKKKGF